MCLLSPMTGGGVIWTEGGEYVYRPERRAALERHRGKPYPFPALSAELVATLDRIVALFEKFNPAWAEKPMEARPYPMGTISADEKTEMKTLFAKASSLLAVELAADEWDIKAEFPGAFH